MTEIITIGCLGPEGTFSHEAVLKIIKPTERVVFFSDFSSLIDTFVSGKIHKAIVPVENTIGGPVLTALEEVIIKKPFTIELEIIVEINHCLIGFGKIDNIKFLYSHPQPLIQCNRFILKEVKKQNEIEIITSNSTSGAVEIISKIRSQDSVAIGLEKAAIKFGVPIIKRNIGDCKINQTRFLLLNDTETVPTGKDKTTFVVRVHNQICALSPLLSLMCENNIGMSMIISMASKKMIGDYVFYIDIHGHKDDVNVSDVMEKIKSLKVVEDLIVLGSYSRVI